jgi:hypothetical protein
MWHAAGLLAADALSIEQVALHARCQSRNSSVEPSGRTTAPILKLSINGETCLRYVSD